MSRVIKFRAWDGYSISPVAKVEMYSDTTGNWHYQYEPFGHVSIDHQDTTKCLMQFTGLLDKNGKEIYEGDLLLTDDMHHDYEGGVAINALPDGKIVPVEFLDGAFLANGELLCEYATAWEIVGNVWENPDLLKV